MSSQRQARRERDREDFRGRPPMSDLYRLGQGTQRTIALVGGRNRAGVLIEPTTERCRRGDY
jgi:hypothetical protein